ncbi:hypothetical protein PSN45_000159 [Yamadazyma tenuis]|uniref:SUN domain-containing protein n=1 Tax=Candida tenuis (strain ATCC 10573 / BCRC 21748 / CBS 615 / JCM 9827 / NBRC 10315 / NRRL Y-1498 / VKM Y-70) TaxID=590646 RepID=G3BAZ3_CANTC|nr:uncharacterized protein CANTEDRAFT_108237 [Yamadazyma tenuis ATCC 10573]EGV61488.1 hypothetical protein CANTEDRAFT_108237 [Yamadazyma tenuis ATCC 10573]WEJ92704.1 hypothetical protein PSN45_000159 [Yamadazyma tenuis]
MSRFPGIPTVVGDTDDDASIHLNSKVGPARPLPQISPKEQEIANILSKPSAAPSSQYNEVFETYYRNGGHVAPAPEGDDVTDHSSSGSDYEPQLDDSTDEESDEDATEVETPHEKSLLEEPQDISIAPEPPIRQISPWKQAFLSVLAGITLAVVVIEVCYISVVYSRSKHTGHTVENYYEVNSKFEQLGSQVSHLASEHKNHKKAVEELANNQKHLQQSYEQLSDNVMNRFHGMESRFETLDTNKSQINGVIQEVRALKVQFESVNLVSNHTEFDHRLNLLTSKLDRLVELNDNIETIKADVLATLFQALPSQVPVYTKNNKIHYIPEFNKFLYNFIDSYFKEHGPTDWNAFVRENKESLDKYVKDLLSQSGVDGIDKSRLHQLVAEQLAQNNQVIFDKFNNLVDNLNVDTNSTVSVKHDKILLSSLLEMFSEGSVNTNYADYRLGTKILGFLTSVPSNDKPLPRKLLLGWYDYLVQSSPSYTSLKFNANNLLVDGGSSWRCQTDKNGLCSVGIKLSSPVIITDVVVATDSQDSSHKAISIYVKPKSSSDYETIARYLSDFKMGFKLPQISNKYLKKFIKVKEASLDKPINHIKLPISLVNLQVPARDLYVEFQSNQEVLEVRNIKVYGISQYRSQKYSQKMELLIDNLKQAPEPVRIYDDVSVLGSDETIS